MLRRYTTVFCACLAMVAIYSRTPESMASPGISVGRGDNHSVEVEITGEFVVPDAAGASGLSGTDSADTGVCRDDSGAEIACWNEYGFWSYDQRAYCSRIDIPTDSLWWVNRLDVGGSPTGYFITCHAPGVYDLPAAPIWVEELPDTPYRPGSDPEAVVREAVASLQLHPPTVGITAFVYPDFEEHGLTWWVGAQAWLWVDASDDLQWGVHEVSAHLDGVSVDAVVEATSVTFDPGDGGEPVICHSAGTPRAFHAHGTISDVSPSGCDYQYLRTTDDQTEE